MTSLDQAIDGGLPWFRGLVLGGGTRPGARQEQAPNQPQNQLVPEVIPPLGPTSDLSRQGIPLVEHGHNLTTEKPGVPGRERGAAG